MFPKRSSNNRSIALLLGDDLGWFPEMDALHQYLFLNKGNIVLLLDMPIDTQRPFVREHVSQVFLSFSSHCEPARAAFSSVAFTAANAAISISCAARF